MFDKILSRFEPKTPEFPDNKPMFYPGFIKRSDGLPVDATLADLHYLYSKEDYDRVGDPDNIHALYHRTASASDLEPRLYEQCVNNPTSMGNWFAPLVRAHAQLDKPTLLLPKTRIMRLDQELAQTLRLEYHEINKLSQNILDTYFFEKFKFDKDAEYFIKTGTFSGKFQFANAHCTEPDEIAQYFQVINNFAMFVGAGESVDLVVRDYIAPEPNTPEIYNGMPLRCEYRLFVDFGDNAKARDFDKPHSKAAYAHAFADPEDTDTTAFQPSILGTTHYWHRRVMRQHFAMCTDPSIAVHTGIERQDAYTYRNHEAILDEHFNAHLKSVENATRELIPAMRAQGFRGQWSIDVMVNNAGTNDAEFYLIDMAPMCESALVDELDTVDELRYTDIETIHRYAERKMLGYAAAPEYAPETVTDGHGVAHDFVLGDTTDALRSGVKAGYLSTDGSQIPPLETRSHMTQIES